ncbi:conserved Plasmodium protein, unknown function [Plasmodium vivax]|uniref:Uncharacterized protein n=2 Tax=Plasmodium vivax TaxID=5855 RepID=A0A1G4GU54_PLAVI|nr:hypothetical protein PVNG_04797 [Plasmodium vivax North Korean]SCO66112.1 conserved Plasmodium protein, unknown function [Plasmodium vivax]SCO71557.1 conserved Plasmodium protein, unknown function [Plasmodium vivax]
MEEEKPDEDEEVTVGKNIIHNNFENEDFLSNFRLLLERQWPHGVRSAIERGAIARGTVERAAVERIAIERGKVERDPIERAAVERIAIERGTVERSKFEGSAATSEAGPREPARREATRRRGQGTKKLIIHLVPSRKSDLYTFLKKKKEQVLNKYGKDETYKYESHISLTGYFFCNNIVTFAKSLYVYLFYYVKLYHVSRTLSLRDLFFCIPCGVGGRWERLKKRDQPHPQPQPQPQQLLDVHPASPAQPVTRNAQEKRILTTNDGYVIIPIMCEWLKRIFENFRFLIKNDSFASRRKYGQGGRDKSSRRHLRKRSAVKKEGGHFAGARGRRHRVEEEQSEELPLRIPYQGNNATGVIHPVVGEECPTPCEGGNTPLAQHNGEEPALQSCARRSRGRCSVSSVSTSASSGDLGLCSEVAQVEGTRGGAQVGDASPALGPSVCEEADPARSGGMGRSSGLERSSGMGGSSKPIRNCGASRGNKIKYRYNHAKVRLLEFRIKNCNHISLASNRRDQGVQNEIAHMYRDMKYHFSNCAWDLVMFECVEGGEIANGSAGERPPGGNPLLNEIFRFRNFAVS